MALTNYREFWNPDRITPLVEYGILLRVVPSDHTLEFEIDRAPDSGGSPGTFATVAQVGPFPKSGGSYWDPRPNDNNTYWYRARHVGVGITASAYTSSVSGVPRRLDNSAHLTQLGATSNHVITEDINASAVTPTEAQARRRCKMQHSANQSVSDGGNLTLAFDTEIYDTAALHDTVTNNSRITIPAGGNTGVWLFVAQVSWAPNANGRRLVSIRKNGGTFLATVDMASNGDGSDNTDMNVVAIDNAPSVSDYYEVLVEQTSGGSLNVEAGVSTFAALHLW